MNTYIREPINGLTHLFGAILSLTALIVMLVKAVTITPSPLEIAAIVIYGISLILLYSTSATYHMVIASNKVISFLQRLDHSMIFILIAGSYTPLCLIALRGTRGYTLFFLVLGIAVLGILFKMIWFKCPRWLSTLIYLFMGWICIFAISPLYTAISVHGVFWLALGGLFYTVGGIIYAAKSTIFKNKYLGFHEIFHIFILLGSASHFICIFNYVIK